MDKPDLSTIARTPVGVDERFDQSGRQEVVEQNGNDGAHYGHEGRARIAELDDLVLSLQCKVIERDAELAALKAQEPVGWWLKSSKDGAHDLSGIGDPENVYVGVYDTKLPLYAAPVVSAEQQGMALSREACVIALRLIHRELETLANGSAIERFKAAKDEFSAMLAAPAPSTAEDKS